MTDVDTVRAVLSTLDHSTVRHEAHVALDRLAAKIVHLEERVGDLAFTLKRVADERHEVVEDYLDTLLKREEASVSSAERRRAHALEARLSVPVEAVVRAVARLLPAKFDCMRAWSVEDVREHAVMTVHVRLSIPISCALPKRVERGRARDVLSACGVYDEGEMDEILDRACDEVAKGREKNK